MNHAIRHADNFEDYRAIEEIASSSPPLVAHDPYIYWIVRRCLSEYTYFVCIDEHPVGFVTTMPMSHDPNSIYFWQLGIMPDHRRKGLASKLVERAIQEHDVKSFEVNIAPDNAGSIRIFEKAALSINRNLVSIETRHEPEMFNILKKYNESYFVTV